MKSRLFIIAFLIISLLGAFTLKANAQDSTLIADETIMTYSKTGAKIHCSNESVFNKIFTTHGMLFKRFTCTWKTDRHGRYKDYVVYLSEGDADIIKLWAKKNL